MVLVGVKAPKGEVIEYVSRVSFFLTLSKRALRS